MLHSANEEDVVLAFRQAMKEELQKAQAAEATPRPPLLPPGLPTQEALRRLADRYEDLEREVALLRTIVLRLVSEPVDEQGNQE